MFRIILIALMIVLPGSAFAAVGISPSAIEATVPSGTQRDGEIRFMRDAEDSKTKMYVNVFSEDSFILTEGTEYFMDEGVREISIPYRLDTTTSVPGTYTSIFYIRPERAESRMAGNGVSIQVQGGVRVSLTVTAPEVASWEVAARENIRDHIAVYRDTAAYYANVAAASVVNLFGIKK